MDAREVVKRGEYRAGQKGQKPRVPETQQVLLAPRAPTWEGTHRPCITGSFRHPRQGAGKRLAALVHMHVKTLERCACWRSDMATQAYPLCFGSKQALIAPPLHAAQ